MFRKKQLLIPELLVFVLMSAVSANEIMDTIAISGLWGKLPCSFHTSNKTVKWDTENKFEEVLTIAECEGNTDECTVDKGINGGVVNATRSETSSTLLFLVDDPAQQSFRCLLGNVVQQTFNVTFIDKPRISPPNCSIIPTTSHQGRNGTLTFSCESYVTPQLPYRLTMLGFSKIISENSKSGHLHVVNDVNVKNFREYLNVVCELRLSYVVISESCSFPHSTKVTYTPDGMDAVFDCHADPGDTVTWRLLDSDGSENMTVCAWTKGGKMLIKDITNQDLGRVAECRINGSVGFGVIDEIGSSENESYDGTRADGSHRDRRVYVVLTFVFGGLLLLTLLIIISHWHCGACEQPMKWYVQFKPHGKPKTSTTNQLSGSIEDNLSERGTNSRSPGGDVVTIRESNLNSDNQNNSALKHPRDPTPQMKATSSSDAGASSNVHPDQPVVDTNQHTYFCVERSTPPPSLPDLSTSGSVTIYQDPDYEESQGQRLRDSAGYDVVDASKKKMSNNFDMEDYAEVGGAYDMTSNPAIAPRSPKGCTGKGVVMSSDPAVLYGKVNK